MKDEPIRSVSRAFEILEYFRAQQRPLALKEVVQHFGYPVASTADILKSLFHLGYLTFDLRTKTYIPAPHLFRLTSWMSGELIGRVQVVDAMKRLQRETGRSILLGSSNDIELLIILAVNGDEVRPGNIRRVLIRSALGQVLLSAEDEGVVERIYRRTLSRKLVERSSLSLNQLFDRLDHIRKTGYLMQDDPLRPTHSLIAMLAPAPYYNRPMAVAIHGVTEEIEQNEAMIAATLRNFVARNFATHDEEWLVQSDLFHGNAIEAIKTRVH